MVHKGSFVFAQVVTFLNDNKFRRITDKFQGNRYVKHFFEKFAFHMIEQARSRRINHIFQLEGNVYVFNSTTISLIDTNPLVDLFCKSNFQDNKDQVALNEPLLFNDFNYRNF